MSRLACWISVFGLLLGGCEDLPAEVPDAAVDAALPSDGSVMARDDGGTPTGVDAALPSDGGRDGGREEDSGPPLPLPECGSGSRRYVAPITVVAAAASSLTDSMLGRPVDESFTFLSGVDASSLFPDAPVLVSAPHEFRHSIEQHRSTRQLAANAQGWGIGSVEVSASSEARYASYSAYQVSEVRTIDTATAMRGAPPGARWFVRSIQYGRQYSLVLEGTRSSFGAAAQVNLQTYGGGIEAYATEYGLTSTQVGRGLRPISGGAIFARSPGEVEAAYEAVGEPAALFVEYQSVPSACIPDQDFIEWAPPVELEILPEAVHIRRHGGVWSGDWRFELSCRLNGRSLPISGNPIFDRTGLGNVTIPLDWNAIVHVTYEDVLSCSFGGRDTYYDNVLPPGRLEHFVTEGESVRVGVAEGRDSEYHYTVDYRIRLRPL